MNIEIMIQNCGTYIVIGQIREGKQTEINRISNPPSSRIVDIEESVEILMLDVTADEFTPVNKHAESHKK